MRLRRQLALTLLTVTSLTVASALALTLTVFRHAQMRQLDQALLAAALLAAEKVHDQGAAAPNLNLGLFSQSDAIMRSIVLYRADGTVLAHAGRPGRPVVVPTLLAVGWQPGEALPRSGFDVVDRNAKHPLRGALVRVGPQGAGPPGGGGLLLLLLASRADEDADIRYLLEVMAAVLAGAVAASLLIGRFLGGRLSSGIETVAALAERVSRGDLNARVATERLGPQEEIAMLAASLNQMVERLSALRQAEQRFISHAAHELRSPLTVIQGELELALRHPRTDEEYRAAIREALDSTAGLIALAEDLLVLARVRLGEPAPQVEVDLSDVVQDAVRAALPRQQAARALLVEAEPGVAQVLGRRRDLSRMVRNLIDNALLHAPPGTSVRVWAGRRAGAAVVAVEDRGPGVPADRQERIFEPFFRGEGERVSLTPGVGAGLGLSIAREIAVRNGGDLTYRREGGVTCFEVTLPELARGS